MAYSGVPLLRAVGGGGACLFGLTFAASFGPPLTPSSGEFLPYLMFSGDL